jgi:hypothetical protein
MTQLGGTRVSMPVFSIGSAGFSVEWTRQKTPPVDGSKDGSETQDGQVSRMQRYVFS